MGNARDPLFACEDDLTRNKRTDASRQVRALSWNVRGQTSGRRTGHGWNELVRCDSEVRSDIEADSLEVGQKSEKKIFLMYRNKLVLRDFKARKRSAPLLFLIV